MLRMVIRSALVVTLATTAFADSTDTTRPAVETPSVELKRGDFLEYHPADDAERIRKIVQRFSLDPYHFTQESGAELYAATCQGCHMADAKGATGAGTYPPLAGNPKLTSKYYMISVLVNGYHGMPRFGDQMSDKQIAEVVNYVRSNFGNQFPDKATPENVARMRGE